MESLHLFLIETHITALPLKSLKSEWTAVRAAVDKETGRRVKDEENSFQFVFTVEVEKCCCNIGKCQRSGLTVTEKHNTVVVGQGGQQGRYGGWGVREGAVTFLLFGSHFQKPAGL